MTDRIPALTRALLTLSLFFACATLGAGLALFTGWPVAILSGIVGFVSVQHLAAGFARRRDKRLVAKELAHLRKSNLEFETALHDTRARLGDLGATVELRANSQEKKIVAELKVLETLMREFAGKISGTCFLKEAVYLKQLSGKTTTRTAPGSSGTSLKAPARAMPELGPAMMLSSWFSRFASA